MRRTSMGKSTLSPMSAPVSSVAADAQPARAPDEKAIERELLCSARRKPFVSPRTGGGGGGGGGSGPEQSAALRDRLLLDLDQLQSADRGRGLGPQEPCRQEHDDHRRRRRGRSRLPGKAPKRLNWRRLLVKKNLSPTPTEDPRTLRSRRSLLPQIEDAVQSRRRLSRIDASARRRRVAAKTIRLRDKEHCRFVASQPCIVCGRTPSEAHHIRSAQPRALGRKVRDE